MSNRPTNKAFTLLEMLVALAITGAIVTMVYGSYAATSRSLGMYNSRMACSRRAHLVLRLMARQIRCVYAPSSQAHPMDPAGASNYDNRPGSPSDGSSMAKSSSAIFRGDLHEPRGEILSFTTTGGLGLGPDGPGGLSRMAYRYEARNGTLSLSCEPCVHPRDDRRDARVWRPILSGVTNIELQFHDGQRWQQAWNSTEAEKLPRAVRIALTLAGESGRTHHYETTVPIGVRTSMPIRRQKAPAGRL